MTSVSQRDSQERVVFNDFERFLSTFVVSPNLEKYDLNADEMRLVAHLVHIRPGGSLREGVAVVLRVSHDDAEKVVTGLEYKGFVRTGVASTGQRYVVLTQEAKDAFKRNEPLPEGIGIDFVEMLKSADPDEMRRSGYGWIRNFKSKISLVSNPFTRAWTRLGINDLSDGQALGFCMCLIQFIKNFTVPFNGSFTAGVGVSRTEYISEQVLDELVQKGLLISVGNGRVISPNVAEGLFRGHDEIVNYKDISSKVQIIKAKDIKKINLFFSSESEEEIGHLHQMLTREGYEYACSVLNRKKRNPAIMSLLWGGPGTGKTETVKQISMETGRDIFLFDVSRVTASEWGATENLYRDLFRAYRYVVAVKSLTPILLFNEADQVLAKRMSSIGQSLDKAENCISNLLLQEFEDLHGILLATTNHIDLLDEAFDRRFLFKTELQKPDARARKSIWMSMIPELSEQEAEKLAQEYEMSGAQISNVAAKREMAEVYYRGDRGMEYIQKLCDKETSTEKRNSKNKKIGF